MNFSELLKNELNESITENGAVGYSTTGSKMLDFNFKLSSYRDASENTIIKDFIKVWHEDKELALKFLFYIRDVREGAGERRIFRTILPMIVDFLDDRVFDWIAEYGRYDELFVFFGTKLESNMIQYVKSQLLKDSIDCTDGKSISLLAKWMPSINASSIKTKKMAIKFIDVLGLSPRVYRKTLSKLRNHIDVIERKLCANEWSKVNYNTVPSQANLKYSDAFMKHDKVRRSEFLKALKEGKPEVKINSSVLFPHDIVHKYSPYQSYYRWGGLKYNEALEQLWKALPDYVNGKSNMLVVRDGSGSMTNTIGKTDISALDVSTALAIYTSERLADPFKNKFITFSARPKFIDLTKCESLKDKLEVCFAEDDCSNTNIEATFDLVLQTALNNNLRQEDIPDLLIISDLEFDAATGYSNKMGKLFTRIAEKYNEHGYCLPKLVFWNVSSRTGTIPVVKNDLGVNLISGFSPAVLKVVMQEEVDPYKALVNIISSKRYEKIFYKTI